MHYSKKNTACSRKILFACNCVLFAATLFGNFCYMEFGGLLLKGIASLGFVLIGGLNFLYTVIRRERRLPFPLLMLLGLVFSMLGDIILNIDFLIGALVFAVGHVFYFAAYSTQSKTRGKDLIPTAVIFGASAAILLFVPVFDFGSILMQIVCVFYALVISLMVGKAISNLIKGRSLRNIILTIGSTLFYFSDFMLVFCVFSDAPRIMDYLCMYSYYPAQCLLGMSILLYAWEAFPLKRKGSNERLRKTDSSHSFHPGTTKK